MAAILRLVAVLHLFTYGFAFKLATDSLSLNSLEGTTVDLTCTVAGEEYDFFDNPITWFKVLSNGEEISMNNAKKLLEPFKGTKRYSISKTEKSDPATFSIDLKIENITVAENGTYKCSVYDRPDEKVSHTLMVMAKVKSFTFETNKTRRHRDDDKDIFEFTELEPARVSCRAVGGNPQPVLSIHRGRVDVTQEFKNNIKEVKSGEKGIEVTTYDIELVKNDFRGSKDFTGHNLKCISKIPKLPESKQVKIAEMDIQYAPTFECAEEIAVFANTKDFRITCHISANPKTVLGSVQWTHETKVVNKSANSTMIEDTDYTTNITDSSDGKIVAEVIIPVVNETHYRVYTLTAENALGERQRTILLSAATKTVSTTTSKPNPPYETNGGSGGKADPVVTGKGAATSHAPSLGLTLIVTAIYWINVNHR